MVKEINKCESFKRSDFPGGSGGFGGGPQVPASPNRDEAKDGKGGEIDKGLLAKGHDASGPAGTPAGKKGSGGVNEFADLMRMHDSVIKEHDGSTSGTSDAAKNGKYGQY